MRMEWTGLTAAGLIAWGGMAAAQPAPAPWFVNMKLTSGPSSCSTNYVRGVREQGNAFTFLDANGKETLWTATMAADGSVAPMETKAGNARLKVTIPAGKGPRAFDVQNLGSGCVWKAEPK